jgi:hypothetical protein
MSICDDIDIGQTPQPNQLFQTSQDFFLFLSRWIKKKRLQFQANLSRMLFCQDG